MRYEIKFPIYLDKINLMSQWLNSMKDIKLHYKNRIVNSIYYDDDNLNCARDNISGISNRKKFRIRWYDNNKNNFRYEIKIKKNKLSNKIIFESKKSINLNDYKNLFKINSANFNLKNQDLKYIGQQELKPYLQVSYLRQYLIYKNKIRITIDQNLKFNNFFQNNFDRNLNDNINVLEVKFDESNYDEGFYLIKNCYFTPKRFSKYLRGLSIHGLANYL